MLVNKKQVESQTQFSTQEPILEDPDSFFDPNQMEKIEAAKKKKKRILIIVGVIVMLVTTGLLYYSWSQRPRVEEEEEPTIVDEEPQYLDDELIQINRLRDQLDAADPTKQDLPFPGVDMEIRIN